MPAVVEAPLSLVEKLAEVRFPAKADARLQRLMDRNSQGTLTAEEKDELAGLAELSVTMSLFRAQALRLLGRQP
jgi:hypothetical protein